MQCRSRTCAPVLLALFLIVPAASNACAQAERSPSAQRAFDTAMQAYDEGRFDDALRRFSDLAEDGDPEAAYMVGVMYEFAEGVIGDYTEAARWYEQGARGGFPRAQLALGLLYLDGNGVRRDYGQAAEWLRKAAMQGDPYAQLNLGVMYVNGEGVEPDLQEAYTWYHLASQQGLPEARDYLQDISRSLSREQIAAARARADRIRNQEGSAGPTPGDRREETATAAAETGTSAGAPVGGQGTVQLTMLNVRDPQVGGDEAFRMLIPEGWKVEGGVRWQPRLSNLASVAMQVRNPDGPEMLQVFPNLPFAWKQGGIFGFQPGSVYLGQFLQRPPRDARAYVQNVILPRLRAGVNAQIVDSEELPAVARQVSRNVQEQGVTKQIRAERVRIEYRENGTPLQEDIYCVLVYARSPMNPGFMMWSTERAYSFRARKGELESYAPLLQSMISSVKINPTWFAKYMQVVQMWQQNQMQAIQSAGELSRYIARTNDEITRIHQQAYEQRQRSLDQMSREFSEYVRGVETYDDPVAGRDVQLPSSYEDAWVSANGEYLLSNEAGFDPNANSTQTWYRLKPQN